MFSCNKPGDFQKYFNENMQDLGLPVPSTLFDNVNMAIAYATTMAETLATLGKGATMGELIGATTGLEKLKVAAAIGAAGYVGAMIGSIAVASGRLLGCGSRIADMFVFLDQNNLMFKGWHEFYVKNPQILDNTLTNRAAFGVMVRKSPGQFEYS